MLGNALRMLVHADDVRQLIERQQQLIHLQETQIQLALRETAQARVGHSRQMRDMISRFLVVLDTPEEQEEVRDLLHAALTDLSDEVARLEEYV